MEYMSSSKEAIREMKMWSETCASSHIFLFNQAIIELGDASHSRLFNTVQRFREFGNRFVYYLSINVGRSSLLSQDTS